MKRRLIHNLNLGVQKINRLLSNSFGKMSILSRAIMATLLGLFLSTCLIQPLSMTTSAMFSAPERKDFQLPDLFAQIADNRPVRKFDNRIIIVNIGRNGRQEIAEALSILSLCGPKAVGVDINFAEPSEDDSYLLDVIQNLPDAVFPLGVSSKKEGGKFQIEDKPFFYDELQGINYGVVNLPLSSEKGTVREYAIDFPVEGGSLPSFVTAIAEIASPEAAATLRGRQVETGVTSYHSREYETLNLEEIEDHAEDLTDKIVLIGALEDAVDMHSTPVKSHVAGIMLHASALSTVLDSTWYNHMPKSYDYGLAIALCLAIMLIVYGCRNNFRGFILRIVQASLAYVAVRIGYGLFVDHNIIFDISFTITIIAFGLFAADIWNSIEALWGVISKKLSNLDAKINTATNTQNQLC